MPNFDLPDLNDNELLVSQSLEKRIIDTINRHSGRIGFDRFIQLALFEPELGYYASNTDKFGRSGDFITAPEISSLYSKTLARQCQEILNITNGGDILELGAGSGVMAKDILQSLNEFSSLPSRYFIIEPSRALQLRQKQLFETHIPELLNRIIWVELEQIESFSGVILANEMFDALPFKRIIIKNGEAFEQTVSHNSQGFYWQIEDSCQASSDFYHQYIQTDQILPDGYQTEWHSSYQQWIKELSRLMDAAVLLIMDYGSSKQDYYRPGEIHGSMRCFFRHRVHDDPFVNIGLQDITCNVQFSALAQMAAEQHLELLDYTTQTNFLLANGIDEIFMNANKVNETENMQLLQQMKTLTMPDEMG